MTIICITQKLQKELGLSSVDLIADKESSEPFIEWYANIFILNRKKYVIFVESQTLFSFTLTGVNRQDLKTNLPELFKKALSQALYDEDASAQVISKVVADSCNEIKYAKTANRRILGAMNEFIKQYKFELSYRAKPTNVCDRVNRHLLIRGFPDSTEYETPIEVFVKIIRQGFGLDFEPLKEK